MATCKECFHFEACSGFKPTDLDKDVFHYLQMGCSEEIPDIDKRCDAFKQRTEWVEVVRCRGCIHWHEPEGVCLKIYSDGAVSPYAWQDRNPDDFCSYGERKDNE